MRKALAAGGKLTEKQVEQVAEAISGRSVPVEIKELKEEVEVPGGKVSQAAASADIDRVHLYRLIKRHRVRD